MGFLFQTNRKILQSNMKNIRVNTELILDKIKTKTSLSKYSQGQGSRIVWCLSTNISTEGKKASKGVLCAFEKVVKLIMELRRLLIHLIICCYLKCEISLLGLLQRCCGWFIASPGSEGWSLQMTVLTRGRYSIVCSTNQAINSCWVQVRWRPGKFRDWISDSRPSGPHTVKDLGISSLTGTLLKAWTLKYHFTSP